MSRFFVGQRVRLVVSVRNAGVTGRILALGLWTTGDLLPCNLRMGRGTADCVVRWDCPVTHTDGPELVSETPCATDRLEPILPEGHQPSEFTTLADLLASLEVTA